jgi:hypothetical protein
MHRDTLDRRLGDVSTDPPRLAVAYARAIGPLSTPAPLPARISRRVAEAERRFV